MRRKWLISALAIAVLNAICIFSYFQSFTEDHHDIKIQSPDYNGEPYVALGDNIPRFTDKEKRADAYEYYSEFDAFNRCGYAMACIGIEMMPTEERQSIGQVKPSGWQTVKYDFVDGMYLYNRCHLIAYQLTGENANPQNLITGTRYLNMEGMLPFENMVADYIKETGNHVIYRVTPDFQGHELLARGVTIEGWSVEDQGAGICFYVYAYNVQPGVRIDYATGDSCAVESNETEIVAIVYIINTDSKRFHMESCKQGQNIDNKNKESFHGSRELLLLQGYVPAGCCDP